MLQHDTQAVGIEVGPAIAEGSRRMSGKRNPPAVVTSPVPVSAGLMMRSENMRDLEVGLAGTMRNADFLMVRALHLGSVNRAG